MHSYLPPYPTASGLTVYTIRHATNTMCVGRERVSPAADEHAAFLECEDAARFHIFFLDMNGQEVDVSKFREWHEAGSFAGRFMVRNAETFKHMVSMSDPLRRNIPLVFRECSVTGACVNEFQLGRKADSAGVFQYSFRQTSQGDNWCIHKYGGERRGDGRRLST